MKKEQAKMLRPGDMLTNKKYIGGVETGYDYRVLSNDGYSIITELVIPKMKIDHGRQCKVNIDDIENCIDLRIDHYCEDNEIDLIDGYTFSDEEISYKDIKTGDVVIEGPLRFRNLHTLTNVDGTYWEYFDTADNSYHSTSPEFCKYVINGQAHCKGKLLKIKYKDYVDERG